MTFADEETRAAMYRAQLERREIADTARKRQLAGSTSAATALRERFQPLLDWMNERNVNDGRREEDDT